MRVIFLVLKRFHPILLQFLEYEFHFLAEAFASMAHLKSPLVTKQGFLTCVIRPKGYFSLALP